MASRATSDDDDDDDFEFHFTQPPNAPNALSSLSDNVEKPSMAGNLRFVIVAVAGSKESMNALSLALDNLKL
ncbi:hypothetical protein GBA52_003844 [Prunus armeniaca]|nr:hypothetical protein GBA52_003844 [Prunus armeniaca]